MARIADLLAAGRTYSFEFFPPKTDDAARELEKTLAELEPLRPSFVSVTYGAGGSTRARTHEIVVRLRHHSSMTPMAHLTCVGHRRDDLEAIVRGYEREGVENILALAGDPPAGAPDPEGDLRYALELVELIRSIGGFSVGVAAHPEGHPRSTSREDDRRHTARKLAEADFAVCQFTFEARHWVALVEELSALGVDKPVLPGIMPVTNLRQIERMAALSGAAFPRWLAERLEAAGEDPAEVRRVGVEAAIELCRDLLDAGAPGLHFYTLNRSTATREIYAALGL